MILFPSAARTQSGSPYNKDFQVPQAGGRFVLDYTAESNAASTLDCKLQYWTGSAWADLLNGAEVAIDFVQLTGVSAANLTVYPGLAEELTTGPTLTTNLALPTMLRAVVTLAGATGPDTVTFSLRVEPIT